jgi:4-hydroxy-tetrahydrodipicolinate synthase
VGARGFTSGLANVRPDLSMRLLRALVEGEFPSAMGVWSATRDFERLRTRHSEANNVSVVKEAMSIAGICERTVRAPLTELNLDDRTEVERLVAAWDLHKSDESLAYA